MRADILPISDLPSHETRAWEELGARALVPNPFIEPDFVRPAMRAWGAADVGVLVVRGRGEWLAAVPVRRVRSWRSVPGRCLVAWRHAYCYLGTPLVAGDDPEAVLATLLRRGLHSDSCLALDWIDADGPLAEPLRSAAAGARTIVVEEFERAALCRPATGDHPDDNLSGRHRREYARKLRLLEREVGELTVRDRSGDPAAYRRFLELERAGWRGEIGTAMDCIPGHGPFFIELCRRFSESGRLRLLSLDSEQQSLAMRTDLIAGNGSFFFKPVFDEAFGRFSPGVQLELANIERFRAGDLAWSDSCTAPDNAMLNKLWPGRRRLRSIVATPRRAAGTLAYAKWRSAAAALPVRRKIMARLH